MVTQQGGGGISQPSFSSDSSERFKGIELELEMIQLFRGRLSNVNDYLNWEGARVQCTHIPQASVCGGLPQWADTLPSRR